ncbi:transporter [Thermosipho melanesiensis]|uniref:Auxin Efflux Carrier n=3 Tax=Thermosipho melanesiensis TaxID=46541 RepID=A6LNE5_THEM4|nr:AEC family transporter [Thermosipho melanesiensis]ABR31446.1 Auxin Efflux Carrier [Thermosipho melanesiensis BI429]APT74505.1 transporter [Thermosipho melanesiensis]OOC36461.1 transporter [Thermosipho melanesiensis]OOC37279.1 transporter [Thermosipho melanesiensis]OOC38031.1 transporter [Thermosipho melanesiensis]
MITTFFNILPPFLIILIGFIFGKAFSFDIKIVSKLSLWIMATILTFTFINDYPPKLSQLNTYGFGVAILFIIFYFVSLMFKEYKSLIFTNSVYINTGYLGYPILLSVWGEQALSYGVIYSILNMILGSIFVPMFLGKNINVKNIFKLPYIYVITIAYILSISGISYKNFPKPILETILLLKNAAIPLLLLYVGLSLSKINFKKINFKIVISTILIRLFIYPTLALIFVFITSMEKSLGKVFILESAMPTAINSVILIDAITGDSSDISLTVAATTLISAFTIPIWVFLIERFI